MKFPRATSQPLGTQDWIIDVPFLKHVRHSARQMFKEDIYTDSLDLELIEQILLAAEPVLETEGHK